MYEEARKIIRQFGLKSQREYVKFYSLGKIPSNIPKSPRKVYKNKGWVSFPDFLGTGTKNFKRSYLPFEEAREFVRKLGLITPLEWLEYCKSGKCLDIIPTRPSRIYPEYLGIEDWLGIDLHRHSQKKWRVEHVSFEETVKFYRKFNLMGRNAFEYLVTTNEAIPFNIPLRPKEVYRLEWESKNWAYLLGDGYKTEIIMNKYNAISLENEREIAFNNRKKIVSFYNSKCSCCGNNYLKELCVDHLYGRTNKIYSKMSIANTSVAISSSGFRKFLIDNPRKIRLFRVLCLKCNITLGRYGRCSSFKHNSTAPCTRGVIQRYGGYTKTAYNRKLIVFDPHTYRWKLSRRKL